MPQITWQSASLRRSSSVGMALLTGGMMVTTLGMMFLVAPQEASMGDVQRIVYLHVALAWSSLAGTVAMGVLASAYLVTRRAACDEWSQAAAEIAWLASTVTLLTGSLWAHEAWNTWWTWEPRLTTTLILWAMLAGYFLTRVNVVEAQSRARLASVLALIVTADVPLIVMATRWFRGMHPVAPQMEPTMRLTLAASVVSFTVWFVWLASLRKDQLSLRRHLTTSLRPYKENA